MKLKFFIFLFLMSFPIFGQNGPCEYSLVFSYIPGTNLVEGTNNEYELRLPNDKWTATGGVQTSSGRGNGSGTLSFLKFIGYIKKQSQIGDNGKTGRVYQIAFTNNSSFTIELSLDWEKEKLRGGGYTLIPGETRTSVSNYYKDGGNHPKFNIRSVQIKFTHEQEKIYGTYYSKYFNCTDTPNEVANKILEDKKEAELKEEERKVSNLSENSIENIESKINAYKSLASKHEAKTFKNEIERLEKDKKTKQTEDEITLLKDSIKNIPENNEVNLNEKIRLYEDLASLDREESYKDKISDLQTKKKELKNQTSSAVVKRITDYPVSKSDFMNDGNKETNNTSSNSRITSSVSTQSKDLEKAEKYYNSAYKNAQEGNFTDGIKDLKLQKAYTSDPSEIAKINSNIKTLEAQQNYQNNWTQVNERIERENYLNQQSLDFINKVDAAANGNDLQAAFQKGGYAIGSAVAGRLDVNSAAGAVTSLISHFGNEKREKEELEAKKRALKKQVDEENRIREIERQEYLNGLKRERSIATENIPKYAYPNYLTDASISTYYYFAIYTGQDILNTDYPEADITDIVEIKKYKDGTWPFENDFKASLQKFSSKPIKQIIGYTDYGTASGKLDDIINGFGKGGVKLSFIKASKNNSNQTDYISSSSDENNKDFWGKPAALVNKKTDVIKKEKKNKTDSPAKKEDFWGKTIEIKD